MANQAVKIKPEGRHHQIPRCMFSFFSDLESMQEVESVNSGRFIHRLEARRFDAHIQYYDETHRTFRIRVKNKGFISYFQIKVHPGAEDLVEEYIRNYRPN